MNTYYRQLLKEAAAANAAADQLALIESIGERMSENLATRYGINKADRDRFVRARLDRWITALQVGHRPAEFWLAVIDQIEKSLLIVSRGQARH